MTPDFTHTQDWVDELISRANAWPYVLARVIGITVLVILILGVVLGVLSELSGGTSLSLGGLVITPSMVALMAGAAGILGVLLDGGLLPAISQWIAPAPVRYRRVAGDLIRELQTVYKIVDDEQAERLRNEAGRLRSVKSRPDLDTVCSRLASIMRGEKNP